MFIILLVKCDCNYKKSTLFDKKTPPNKGRKTIYFILYRDFIIRQ